VSLRARVELRPAFAALCWEPEKAPWP